MAIRFGLWTMILLAVPCSVAAQTGPWRGAPDQPVRPQVPTLRQRSPAAEQPTAPFQLTPQHQAYLDRVLQAWEQRSSNVKTFECDFTRWEYDPVFGDADKPKHTDTGHIKYAAPDKGRFEVEGDRAEKWICNGKSIFEYNHTKKQLIEYKLPPHMQGKAIANSPLPFIFGAKADELRRRYFMRVVTPADVKGQIWLEAYPKLQQDAANFKRTELILTGKDMTPHALQIYLPNGKNRTVYQFSNIVINNPLRFFKGDPFHALTPPFWKKIVEENETAQAGRTAAGGRR